MENNDPNPDISLPLIRDLRRNLEKQEELAVKRAVAEGWSWAKIGNALGISKQAAWEKHHKRIKEGI